MNDFDGLLKNRSVSPEAALRAGFRREGDRYLLLEELPGTGLFAEFTLTERSFSARVLEEDGEEFYLLRVKNAEGSFLPAVREALEAAAGRIAGRLFPREDPGKRLLELARDKFGDRPDYPFDDGEESPVLRAPNGKWYAIMMTVEGNRIDSRRKGPVRALNLKVDPEKRESILDGESFFPAYHMNKTHWITVILDGAPDWEKTAALLEESRRLSMGKKKEK